LNVAEKLLFSQDRFLGRETIRAGENWDDVCQRGQKSQILDICWFDFLIDNVKHNINLATTIASNHTDYFAFVEGI